MAVKGVFASDSGIVGDRKGDFASSLLQTQPTGTAPLLALTSGMESMNAMDTVITWFEENHNSGLINVTNNATTGTTLVVDDASSIVPGTIELIQSTGEMVFITAITGTSLTVIRGFAATTITSIDGSGTPVPMQRIGNAQEEGSDKPVAVVNLGFPRFNYTQIFRNTWNVTGTAQAVQFHTGNQKAKSKADAAMFHAEDIEKSLMFGKAAIGVQGGQPFRTMDGIFTQIVTNTATQSTKTSVDELDDFFKDVFSRNIKGKPNERIAFCGNTVIQVINQIAQGQGVWNTESGMTEFGMKVTKWLTPYGDISLMTHPLLNENVTWSKDLYVIHPGGVKTRYLRNTHEDLNDVDGSRAGVDADFGVITTEMSCEYRAELTGGKFTGIDTAGLFALTT